jgi:hypothetical protein
MAGHYENVESKALERNAVKTEEESGPGSLALLCLITLFLAGCSTTAKKDSVAVANIGYVDFYCDTASDLSWDVLRYDTKLGKMKPAYSKYKPLPGNLVRVEAPDGVQRFQVGIFNRANRGPVQVSVDVKAGQVTPVKVTLEHRGQALVDRELYGFRGSSKGYAGGTKIVTVTNDVVKIHVDSLSPQPFQPSDQMAYFNNGTKENKLTPTGR